MGKRKLKKLEKMNLSYWEETDNIELEEIYDFIKKRIRAVVWTAYSKLQKHIIAYHVGEDIAAAMSIYQNVTTKVDSSHVYSDANSRYDATFAKMQIPKKRSITKSQTHLIESSDGSIHDNLARINRRTKRWSKIFLWCYFLQIFFL